MAHANKHTHDIEILGVSLEKQNRNRLRIARTARELPAFYSRFHFTASLKPGHGAMSRGRFPTARFYFDSWTCSLRIS